jgi:hypothetical protein
VTKFNSFVDFASHRVDMTPPLAKTPDPTLTRDEQLCLAVQAFRDNPKQSVHGLAVHFQVAPSTLQGRLAGARSHAEEKQDRRRLSNAETKVLADHVVRMQQLHFPLSPADVVVEATRIFHNKDPVAKANNTPLGKNWYHEVFLKDNPQLKNKLGKGLDRNRATCASNRQLCAWHKDVSVIDHVYSLLYLLTVRLSLLQLGKKIDEYKITPAFIDNTDEKGYLLGSSFASGCNVCM